MAVPAISQAIAAIAGNQSPGPTPLNGSAGGIDFAALLAGLAPTEGGQAILPAPALDTGNEAANLLLAVSDKPVGEQPSLPPGIERLMQQASRPLGEDEAVERLKAAIQDARSTPPTSPPPGATIHGAPGDVAAADEHSRTRASKEEDEPASAPALAADTQPLPYAPQPITPPPATERKEFQAASAGGDAISALPNAGREGSEAAKLAGDPAAREAAPPIQPPIGSAAAANTAPPSPASAEASHRVETPLHDARWAQNFGDRLVWLAKNEQQSAQININPPQLGPVQITLQLNGDQASAMFASPHAEVRQAIQDAMPQLRDMLSAAGINLGQANVGSQSPQQQQEFLAQFGNQNRSTGEAAILPGDDHAAGLPSGQPLQRGRGLVDLFA